jgi:protein-tyrosine phosphatase
MGLRVQLGISRSGLLQAWLMSVVFGRVEHYVEMLSQLPPIALS